MSTKNEPLCLWCHFLFGLYVDADWFIDSVWMQETQRWVQNLESLSVHPYYDKTMKKDVINSVLQDGWQSGDWDWSVDK